MSEAFERFLAGNDRLASLLRELPAFDPPASLEANFLAAAQTAEACVGAARGRSYEDPLDATSATPSLTLNSSKGEGSFERYESAIPPSPSIPLPQGEREASSGCAVPEFEPPASLETSFQKMAGQIDAAQAARREALLAQIAQGESPQAALGAEVQPATAQWLQQQASSTAPAKAEKAPRRAVFFGFSWFDLRLAALSGIMAGAATLLVLKHAPSSYELALRETFRAAFSAQQDGLQAESAQASKAAAPVLAQQDPAATDPIAADKAEAVAKAKPSPAPSPSPARTARQAETAAGALPEIAPPAHLSGRAEIAASFDQAAENQALEKIALPEAAPAPASIALSEQVADQAFASGEAAQRETRAAGMPARPAAMAAAPVAAQMAAAPAVSAGNAAREMSPAKPLAETRQLERQAAEIKAAPRLLASKAKKLAPQALKIEATLADDPAMRAAEVLAAQAKLRDKTWVVFSASPDAPEIQAWVARLRAAVPADQGLLFEIWRATDLPAGQLRLSPLIQP